MKFNIKRKNIIQGAALVVGGIILGALLFSSSGKDASGTQGSDAEAHSHEENAEEETVWTCSMHPQIRQDEPGDCPICGMELIPADEVEADEEPGEFNMTKTAMKLADVNTSEVEKGKPVKDIQLTGKIMIDERLVTTQAVHFPGRIEQLFLNFKGEYVQKGQTIAKVYSPELISAQEELFEAQKSSESSPELVEAAKEKLRQWKLTDDQIDAIIENGEVKEELNIKANTNGIVHKKMVNEGDYVKKGAMLYHIARIDKVWLMFDAYQEDLPFIENGDKINFTVSSMPGKKFESNVTFIDPTMNNTTRVAQIRTEAKNKNGRLKPGMFAEGTLISDNPDSSEELMVPKSAVMWTGKRSVVYVKQPNRDQPSFKLREVVLGSSLGDRYIIEKGLETGEEIATKGTFSVDAAAQLAGKPSMMNQDGAAGSSGHNHGNMSESDDMEQASGSMEKDQENITWPDSQSDQYKALINDYMALKNALVNDQTANKQAEEFLTSISKVDMDAFSQQGHVKWMEHQKVFKGKAQAISKAEKLKEQRNQFIILADHMIKLVKTFKAPDNKLYVLFCPMANDNKGAYWLSEENQVKNPFYGESMLTCGEVREEVSNE
ncbi:MAG: efflux RND transporter periplasmic adaptor subunit [Bacteroidales bacterium]